MKRKSLISIVLLLAFLFVSVSAVLAQDADKAYAEGFKLFQKKKFKEAIAKMDYVLSRNDSHVKAYAIRGLCFMMLDDQASAIKDLDMAIQLDPENVTARFGRGEALLLMGRSEKAIVDFNAVLSYQPNNAWSYMERAICNYRLGKFRKAVFDASKSISNNPKRPEPYYVRGLCYWQQNLKDAAVLDFERAAEIAPDGPYMQLIAYVARARTGNPNTDKLREFHDKLKDKKDKIPYNLIGMMLGRRTPPECLKDVNAYEPEKLRKTMGQITDFFVSQYFYIHDNEVKAKKYETKAMQGENQLFLIQGLVKHQFYEFRD